MVDFGTKTWDQMDSDYIGIPPDWIVHDHFDMMAQSRPRLWHVNLAFWEQIWNKYRWTGEGERVAILDTGVNAHEDLPTPVAERSFISRQSPRDPTSGHGTHVAGSALGRNGIGLAPKAELLNAKVLGNSGRGSYEAIISGIHWALDNGATIINMSLGGGTAMQRLQDALRRANSMGVLVFASAGNAGQRLPQNTIGYPARYLESGCSGAKRSDGRIASFSSAGREMDIVTPGQQIISCSNRSRTAYATMSGTSMSAPVGSGLWAVIQSARVRSGLNRLVTIDDWRNWWASHSIDRGQPGKDPIWGVGIPDYDAIVSHLAAGHIQYI